MSQIQLFIDEDSMDQRFIKSLRARGVDVTSVGEIETFSSSDKEQLALATNCKEFYTHSMLVTFANYTASIYKKNKLIQGL